MKETPILFRTDMVQAYQKGLKSQTRRTRGLEDVNKNPDIWTLKRVGELDYMTRKPFRGRFGAYFETTQLEPNTLSVCPQVCPYGGPGDLLWIRETWGAVWPDLAPVPLKECKIEYRADLPPGCTDYPGQWPAEEARGNPEAPKWRPSIFMPKWASRYMPKLISVRPERLQDITEEDAKAEGAPLGRVLGYGRLGMKSYREGFIELWDEINANRGHGWDKNDWVWRLEFEPMKAEEN